MTTPTTCPCGREFKNKRAAAPHWRACPVERARSAAFVAGIEAGDTDSSLALRMSTAIYSARAGAAS